MSDESTPEQVGYDHIVPLVAAQSYGGPYDDHAFDDPAARAALRAYADACEEASPGLAADLRAVSYGGTEPC